MPAPSTNTETFRVPVEHPSVESVQAILQWPRSTPPLFILLAHGAGAPMDSEFMEFAAEALVERGYAVMRFRYAYMERAAREERRFPPDRAPRLEAVHRAALHALHERAEGRPVVLAGKSMGGRISSHLAAAGEPCAGLLYLGYPLHPAGKPERLRSAHFPQITQPSLFLAGTRDALCDLTLLDQELKNYGGSFELVITEGGDHSFDVLKRSGRTQQEVRRLLVDSMDRWLGEL
jgi:predicted alpha/beta-hydrolase family hydrolase